MQDLFSFVSKPVEITIHRQRYQNHVRIFRGILSDIGGTMVCLRKDSGKRIWIPKPNCYCDTIKELEI